VLFVAEWILMTLAMMLPSAIPFIDAVQRLGGSAAARTAALSYVGVWAILGAFACAGLWLGGDVMARLPSTTLSAAAGVSLLLAAAYQLSPWAQRCQRQCARPFSILARHWNGKGTAALQAMASGFHYGMSCVGCCVVMVVMMLVVGLHDLGWMLLFALLMILQKHARWGVRVGRASALAAAAGGCAMLAGWWTPELTSLQAVCRSAG
jgi:predicted metal-binding membrane protein